LSIPHLAAGGSIFADEGKKTLNRSPGKCNFGNRGFMKQLAFCIKYSWIGVLVLLACGGKLSDDERKRLHEGMATQDIKKVSEGDLQAAGLAYGQAVWEDIQKINMGLADRSKLDSIGEARHVRIYSLIPNDSTLLEIEKMLVEAYVSGGEAGKAELQKAGEDSLLFTKPVFKERPDGSLQFNYAVGVMMSTRTVVLSMPNP
jgi:hypothetical protein